MVCGLGKYSVRREQDTRIPRSKIARGLRLIPSVYQRTPFADPPRPPRHPRVGEQSSPVPHNAQRVLLPAEIAFRLEDLLGFLKSDVGFRESSLHQIDQSQVTDTSALIVKIPESIRKFNCTI